MLLKNLLCQYSGSDPVTFKLKDFDNDVKILTSSLFWVNSSNELINKLNKAFPNRIEIDVRSMDSTTKQEEAVAC